MDHNNEGGIKNKARNEGENQDIGDVSPTDVDFHLEKSAVGIILELQVLQSGAVCEQENGVP